MLRAVIVLLVLLIPSVAQAEARIALLIGNRNYDPSVGILRNPLNDIAVVGQSLRGQGFDVLPGTKSPLEAHLRGRITDMVEGVAYASPCLGDVLDLGPVGTRI